MRQWKIIGRKLGDSLDLKWAKMLSYTSLRHIKSLNQLCGFHLGISLEKPSVPTSGSSPLTPGQIYPEVIQHGAVRVDETLDGPAADLPYAPQYLCYQLHSQLASTVRKNKCNGN